MLWRGQVQTYCGRRFGLEIWIVTPIARTPLQLHVTSARRRTVSPQLDREPARIHAGAFAAAVELVLYTIPITPFPDRVVR
jgi:hypothetical protein